MRGNLFKKTLAFLMAGVMLLSATGCNSGDMANKENQDTSDRMYEGKEFVLEGVDGQIRDFVVKGEKYEVDIEYFGGTDCIMSGAEYDFYYKDADRIYGYDIGKKKSKKLMDFTASGMTNEDTMDIYPFAKDRLMGLSVKQGKSTLMLYEKLDPSTMADRKTITFGGTYIDDGLKSAAIEFNRTNKEYKIEFVDYSEEEDPERLQRW